MVSLRHSPQVPTENQPNATENRPNATENRPNATFLCHFATLLRHSVHDANADLRRIASDFLTVRIRVGEAESGFVSPRRLSETEAVALGTCLLRDNVKPIGFRWM